MLKGFLGANAADAISSAHALLYGGAEANPLIASGIHYIGIGSVLIFGGLGTLLLATASNYPEMVEEDSNEATRSDVTFTGELSIGLAAVSAAVYAFELFRLRDTREPLPRRIERETGKHVLCGDVEPAAGEMVRFVLPVGTTGARDLWFPIRTDDVGTVRGTPRPPFH